MPTDDETLRTELEEQLSFEEGLARTIAWERANPPAQSPPFDAAAEDAALEEVRRISP